MHVFSSTEFEAWLTMFLDWCNCCPATLPTGTAPPLRPCASMRQSVLSVPQQCRVAVWRLLRSAGWSVGWWTRQAGTGIMHGARSSWLSLCRQRWHLFQLCKNELNDQAGVILCDLASRWAAPVLVYRPRNKRCRSQALKPLSLLAPPVGRCNRILPSGMAAAALGAPHECVDVAVIGGGPGGAAAALALQRCADSVNAG